MFGNAPKAIWQRWAPPDEHNRIPLACRALLVQEPGRIILFEAGIGAFFSPKLRERFGVQELDHLLLDNLEVAGFAPEQIDAVVLSHLHFDHAGGVLTKWRENEPLELCFPRAMFVVGRSAWERAQHPHARDRASFIPELQNLLTACGRLEIVEDCKREGHATSRTLGADYGLHFSDGHTPGLMLAEIPSSDGPIVFAGDLVPGRPWVHLPITMGYDRYPELLIEEKKTLLERLSRERGRLFFTHDTEIALARVVCDSDGRFAAGESWAQLSGMPV